ncbi:N-alpha-acetyltransferase 20 isoform X2 [Myiozetetes cayanensis]|uniref:N-alpha-acetyltransferase 20 isoform X2 n=1 Tax=Myiozetetes cayanensis TaxID=478635 RepID=UPI00215EED0C|nr:N-alpha-acetyltransferase 20 isoform X2 [Myiozetetes cayanensis]
MFLVQRGALAVVTSTRVWDRQIGVSLILESKSLCSALITHLMGKAEGSVAREEWHGHVTALSVAPEFRRLGLAAKLMELLEEISEKKGGFFVDLFVRVSNQVAVNMYKQLGYSVYRTVLEYYSASSGEPDEDAYDMRKALSRDTEKKSVIPLPHPVRPEDIE